METNQQPGVDYPSTILSFPVVGSILPKIIFAFATLVVSVASQAQEEANIQNLPQAVLAARSNNNIEEYRKLLDKVATTAGSDHRAFALLWREANAKSPAISGPTYSQEALAKLHHLDYSQVMIDNLVLDLTDQNRNQLAASVLLFNTITNKIELQPDKKYSCNDPCRETLTSVIGNSDNYHANVVRAALLVAITTSGTATALQQLWLPFLHRASESPHRFDLFLPTLVALAQLELIPVGTLLAAVADQMEKNPTIVDASIRNLKPLKFSENSLSAPTAQQFTRSLLMEIERCKNGIQYHEHRKTLAEFLLLRFSKSFLFFAENPAEQFAWAIRQVLVQSRDSSNFSVVASDSLKLRFQQLLKLSTKRTTGSFCEALGNLVATAPLWLHYIDSSKRKDLMESTMDEFVTIPALQWAFLFRARPYFDSPPQSINDAALASFMSTNLLPLLKAFESISHNPNAHAIAYLNDLLSAVEPYEKLVTPEVRSAIAKARHDFIEKTRGMLNEAMLGHYQKLDGDSNFSTFAMANLILKHPEPGNDASEWLERIIDVSSDQFALPYSRFVAGDRVNRRSSAARTVAVYAAIQKHGKRNSPAYYHLALLRSLQNWLYYFPDLKTHSERWYATHDGRDLLAPYYLHPSLAIAVEAWAALQTNPQPLIPILYRPALAEVGEGLKEAVEDLLAKNGLFHPVGGGKKDENTYALSPRWVNPLGGRALLPFIDSKCTLATTHRLYF